MAKIRIKSRDSCISDGVCIALCPDIFEWSEDGKVQIVEEFRIEKSDVNVGKVEDPALIHCARQAADSCPMQVIEIEE
ncbi:MAG: ferredoxin [Candidatus Asgardarchaeia archaeon]